MMRFFLSMMLLLASSTLHIAADDANSGGSSGGGGGADGGGGGGADSDGATPEMIKKMMDRLEQVRHQPCESCHQSTTSRSCQIMATAERRRHAEPP